MAKNLEIRTNEFSGRSYYSTCSLPADEVVLDIDTPYSCTVYKQFRTEVCAECFNYQSGRRTFLTFREYSENAGLSFCNTECKDAWVGREGVVLTDLLAKLESRRVKKKGKAVAVRAVVMDEEIEEAWRKVEEEERLQKQVRKWGQIFLDDFETDLARYVLMALHHHAREACTHNEPLPLSDDIKGNSSNPPSDGESLQFGYSSWDSFYTLQSNETTQVKLFPELLDNHIQIYRVLKALFGQNVPRRQNSGELIGLSDGVLKEPLHYLAHSLNTNNVRRALGVDPGNSFGIWETPLTDESECLGFAIYPIPSFFNHHCQPNIRKERSGRRLRFVTTRPIEAGDELCISYGHVETMTFEERQKTLLEGWYFRCMCSRCIADLPKN